MYKKDLISSSRSRKSIWSTSTYRDRVWRNWRVQLWR